MNIKNIVAQNGYLVDTDTGEKVLECDKSICRANLSEDDGDFGFCAKTINPAFRKDGGRSFYAVLKEDTYWGREYVD